MPSRRQIREVVVQFLYATDIEGCENLDQIRDSFWELTLEQDKSKLTKATVKTLLHWAQGREGRIEEWNARSELAEPLIKSFQADELLSTLNKLSKSESQWSATIDQIKKLKASSETTDIDALDKKLNELYSINASTRAQRTEFKNALEDFPALAKQLEGILATVERLDRISSRVELLESPTTHPAQAELSHLQKPAQEIKELRSEVDQFITSICDHKSGIDEKIAEVVDHYSPERIDPLSRATLRLASYELFHQKDTPTPVIINEAVEVIKKFGNADATRFINGVLDKLAQKRA